MCLTPLVIIVDLFKKIRHDPYVFIIYLYMPSNNNSFVQAIKALKLCCKASWNYVVDLCKIHVSKSQVCHDDVSQNSIADFIMEASEKLAFLLELNQDGNSKINGIITESLVCWSVSENLIATLPTPMPLVKKWVKVTLDAFCLL